MSSANSLSQKRAIHVALVESNWSGHHPTFFKAFAEELSNADASLFALCPNPEEMPDVAVFKWAPFRFAVRPRRYDGIVNDWLSNWWLHRRLRQHERKVGRTFDLVFFACLYEMSYLPRSFPWAWSGLLLHCRAFRMPGTSVPYTHVLPKPQRLLSHPKLSSIAVLDEGAISFVRGLCNGKPVIAFPDFADASPPADDGVGGSLRRFARGRPVVGCLGHLQPTKGVMTLAQVALDPTNADFVFAFVGDLMLGVFTPEEQGLLTKLRARENVFTHFAPLSSEAEFNATVITCGVLFAAYHDFPHSSNILAKAALFEKPVIVSEGYLMAERVRQFRLGEVIPQDSHDDAARAIRTVLLPAWRSQGKDSPDWAGYSDVHSRTALKSAFSEILEAGRAGGLDKDET